VNQYGSMGEESEALLQSLRSTVLFIPSWGPVILVARNLGQPRRAQSPSQYSRKASQNSRNVESEGEPHPRREKPSMALCPERAAWGPSANDRSVYELDNGHDRKLRHVDITSEFEDTSSEISLGLFPRVLDSMPRSFPQPDFWPGASLRLTLSSGGTPEGELFAGDGDCPPRFPPNTYETSPQSWDPQERA
jgi:hypothetical protein